MFFNLNVSEKALVFADVFSDIMAKHIPNRLITFNDKDAPWITSKVKTAIRHNLRVYRKWVNRGRMPSYQDKVCDARNAANKLIKEAKLAYYVNLGNKLSDPKIGQKHFWTAYKKLANQKKTTNIPNLIYLMIILQNNVPSTKMAAFYPTSFLKLMVH